MHKSLAGEERDIPEPYIGITPRGRFDIAAGREAPTELSLDRLSRRRSLLEQLDAGRRRLDSAEAGRGFDRHHAMALDLVRSVKVRRALDLEREPAAVRDDIEGLIDDLTYMVLAEIMKMFRVPLAVQSPSVPSVGKPSFANCARTRSDDSS